MNDLEWVRFGKGGLSRGKLAGTIVATVMKRDRSYLARVLVDPKREMSFGELEYGNMKSALAAARRWANIEVMESERRRRLLEVDDAPEPAPNRATENQWWEEYVDSRHSR